MYEKPDCVLLFLHDLTVAFSNNEAERDLLIDEGTAKSLRDVSGQCSGLKDFVHPALYHRDGPKAGWNVLEVLQTPPDKLIDD